MWGARGRRWSDLEAVRKLVSTDSQPPQLGNEGRQPIRLVPAQMRNPSQSTRAVGEGRDSCNRRYQDYQAAKEKDLAEQKETAFRSQFSFFARDVGLRDEQLPQAETIMRSGGFGMMGSFVPDQATGEWAKDAAADGSASTKTLMAKMVDKRRQQLDATAEQLAGVLDADQLAKFETWRKTQESQLDLMQSFVPDMVVLAGAVIELTAQRWRFGRGDPRGKTTAPTGRTSPRRIPGRGRASPNRRTLPG